ncbi:hypothetical protein BC332_18447 [Capsicum chinense]|nr:hypothetical protein BC332_18447 [Capsicum chinense]
MLSLSLNFAILRHESGCIVILFNCTINRLPTARTWWAGVGEARGDYPFSHHKLTVQFYEASAAQDRKLEGLVHKAILELWRPDPSELALLLAKRVDSSLFKVPPSAYTLTGSSDP